MDGFVCHSCGAALAVPDDVDAVVARCEFCGEETTLPPEILEARAEQRRERLERESRELALETAETTRRSASRAMGILVVLVIAVPLLITGAVLAVVYLAAPAPTTAAAAAAPKTRGGGPAATSKAVEEAKAARASEVGALGEARMTARLKELYVKGCKDVLMPPQTTSGEQTLDTKFVLNGRCVRVLAISAGAGNTLTLEMKTPFGDKLATPPASAEVDFTYCPKTAGPHPTHIIPATSDDYTVAAVECPASLAKKPKK